MKQDRKNIYGCLWNPTSALHFIMYHQRETTSCTHIFLYEDKLISGLFTPFWVSIDKQNLNAKYSSQPSIYHITPQALTKDWCYLLAPSSPGEKQYRLPSMGQKTIFTQAICHFNSTCQWASHPPDPVTLPLPKHNRNLQSQCFTGWSFTEKVIKRFCLILKITEWNRCPVKSPASHSSRILTTCPHVTSPDYNAVKANMAVWAPSTWISPTIHLWKEQNQLLQETGIQQPGSHYPARWPSWPRYRKLSKLWCPIYDHRKAFRSREEF